MLTRNTSSGAPIHHYDINEIRKDRMEAIANSNRSLTRKQKRKQKRKMDKIAKRYGGYIEEY